MAHHHHISETQIAQEKILRRGHSHHDFTHLKPASVIDHLKIKVKRKRLSKHDSSDLSDGTLNSNVSNNNNKPSNQDQTESIHGTSGDSHATILQKKLTFEIKEIQMKEEDHEEDSVVPNEINEDEDIVQWRTDPLPSDLNPKLPGPKLKSIKATKSLPDTSNQPNTKKRRQTVRRMGFQIRDEDFSSIFSDLPSDEHLIIAYPCAWRKDAFMHGRLFLSVNYFCFYTCFFKWEESLCIAYKDIISVTREKCAKVLPNAIKLRTKNQEQYVFTSHIPREKIFVAIFRLWQNALLEQPLNYQQVRALVFVDQQSPEESSGDSEESVALENTGEEAVESGLYTQSLPITSDHSTESPMHPVKLNRRVVSLPPDNKIVTSPSSCPCENHLAKIYADRFFTLNVDTLFTLLFTENSFTRNFHNTQKLTDYNYGEWRLNKETGQRERQVTYKTIAQSVLGSNSLSCREKQILEVEKAKLMYVLSSEVYNEGMKYTDSFYVATRFCIVQRDAEHSSLRVTAEIRYIKSVNGLIRSFIERNAHSSIEDGVNEQVRRLENQQVTQFPSKSNQKIIPGSKHRQRESMNNHQSQNRTQENSISSSKSQLSINQKTVTGKGVFYDIALFIGIWLLVLHIYLCYKLLSFDQTMLTLDTHCFNHCQETCLKTNEHS